MIARQGAVILQRWGANAKVGYNRKDTCTQNAKTKWGQNAKKTLCTDYETPYRGFFVFVAESVICDKKSL